MSAPKGYSTQEKDDRLSSQFQTVEPVREQQFGSSVVSHQFVYEVATDAAEAGSTAYSIVATSHLALKGDVILLTSGALQGREVKVWEVSTNLITLAETLPSAIATGVSFKVLRHKYPSVDSDGKVNVNATIVEQAVVADGGALPALVKVVAGYDGSAVQVLKTDAAGELQVDVLSSALPSGAATSAAQTDGSQKTQIVDGSGNVIGSTGNALDVNLKTPITVDVSLSQANDSVQVYGNDGSANRAIKTDAAGELQVDIKSIEGEVDASNSTTTTLGVSGVFTGSWVLNTNHSSIQVGLKADQNSATDGVEMQFSNDGINVHHTHNYNYLSAGGGIGYLFQPEFRYYRLKYTNGAVAQSSFVLVTTARATALFPSQYRISTTITNETQALMTKAVITGETSSGGGGFVNVKVAPSGALTTEASISSIADVDGQKTMALSFPVVIASDQTTIPVTVSQADDSIVVYGNDGAVNRVLKTDASGELQVDVLSSALPSGAATESTLGDIKTSVQLLDNAISGNEMQVDIVASLPAGTNTIGKVDVNTLSVVDLLDAGILDTSSTNIAGSASSPTQVVSSLAASVKKLQLLDTTGAFIGVYTGAALSEVLQFVMGPGSDQTIEHSIPAGTRISLKRLDSTTAVSSGIVAINFIG